jgi:hypothetical protein
MWALLVLLGVSVCAASLPELECPDECECHYFRINWVTDCSENSLTAMPTNISNNVYILNLNGNNLTTWEPFPAEIKLRRLQAADNLLTRITQTMFSGLGYLIDVDLSGNGMTSIDPDTFQ